MVTAVLILLGKIALLAFGFGGTAAIVVRGFRRSRANRGDPNWTNTRGGQPGFEASVHGAMPRTPLPEWAYWDEDDDSDDDTER